jgi:PHD/YefM family antitoxin component YafN of YafNO toxin-antitoxin module
MIRIGDDAMTITTISSRELNQDVTRAKKAAKNGPVFITDRGKLAHVLLNIDEYQRLTKQHRNIADSLAMPGVADIEFLPQRMTIAARPADFS